MDAVHLPPYACVMPRHARAETCADTSPMWIQGMADSLRGILRLPPSDAAHGDDHEEEEEDTLHGVASDRHYGSLEQRLGPKGASVVYRQFAPAGSGDKDGDREWV
jgi:hypothetical protein